MIRLWIIKEWYFETDLYHFVEISFSVFLRDLIEKGIENKSKTSPGRQFTIGDLNERDFFKMKYVEL